MKLNKNHILVTSTDDVRTICAPLFENTEITYFEYVKVDNEGRGIKLDTSDDFSPYIIEHNIHLNHRNLNHRGRFALNSLDLCTEQTDPRAVNLLQVARNYFNIDYGFSILEQHNNYVEIFTFATKPGNSNIVPFYFSHIDFLERFITYFKVQAENLIKQASKPQYLLLRPYYKNCAIETANKIATVRAHNVQIRFDLLEYPFFYQQQKINLSYREAQVLKQNALGKTAQAAARILGISPRTYEKHLENIKHKFGCQRKQDLQDIFYRNETSKLI